MDRDASKSLDGFDEGMQLRSKLDEQGFPRNLEIKKYVLSLGCGALHRAMKAGVSKALLAQRDSFFRCDHASL